MTFGQQIQMLRKQKGLSQDALASQLYVTRQSVSQWENDKAMPSVDLLVKLSEIYDTTVDKLLGKAEDENEPLPIAEAHAVKSRRKIHRAMSGELGILLPILFFVFIGFCVLAALNALVTVSTNSAAILEHHTKINLCAQIFAVGLMCLIPALILFVIRSINGNRAYRFANANDSLLKFYYDRMMIINRDSEPTGLFYSNIKRIIETDHYFILKMQNGIRLCVDKRELEGDGEQLAKLLKSANGCLGRTVMRHGACQIGEGQTTAAKIVRDFFFVLSFFCVGIFTNSKAVLLSNSSMSAAARWALYLLPFAVSVTAVVCGIIFLIKGIRSIRMIISGGTVLLILLIGIFTIHCLPLYNFQMNRVTPEQFTASMQSHGLEVSDTIYGRQETFITDCLTAEDKNHTFEILYMNFDDTSGDYGLTSAYEFYYVKLVEVQSNLRSRTKNLYMNYGYNAFYTELTNNKYAYASLNEYTVIYVYTSNEKAEEVQNILSDFEMALPY